MAKSLHSFTLDANIMERVKERIPRGELSRLIENFLKSYIGIVNDDEIPEDVITMLREEDDLVKQQVAIQQKLSKIASIKKKKKIITIRE